jgi:hypothetical protein
MKSRRRRRHSRRHTFKANPVRRRRRSRARRRRNPFLANPRRRRRSRRSFRRNPAGRRRRRSRRGGGGSKLSLATIKGAFNKDNIKTGVGVLAATTVMTWVSKQDFSKSLPGVNAVDAKTREYAKAAYLLLIPGLVGIFVRKFDRAISDGLIIGGISLAAVKVINTASPETGATLGFSASPGYGSPIRGLGAGSFGSAPRGSGLGVLASASPFPSSNWGK